MSISIHIEGATGKEVMATLAELLNSANAGTAMAAANAVLDKVEEKPAAKPAEAKKAEAKPKTETKPKEEPKTEARKPDPEPETEDVDAKADNDDAGAETETKAEADKGEKLTVDSVRQKALDWVNTAEPKDQTKRRDLFQAMLKNFDLEKFGDIKEDQLADVAAYIDEQQAEAA